MRRGAPSEVLIRGIGHAFILQLKLSMKPLRNQSFRHPRNLKLVQLLMEKHSKRFYVRIERMSYQHDHIHLLARSVRRSQFHNFFRVFAGQIAPLLKVTDTLKLWKERPFTRIVMSHRSYKIVCDYITLNELEARGQIAYKKERLRGLSSTEWELFG